MSSRRPTPTFRGQPFLSEEICNPYSLVPYKLNQLLMSPFTVQADTADTCSGQTALFDLLKTGGQHEPVHNIMHLKIIYDNSEMCLEIVGIYFKQLKLMFFFDDFSFIVATIFHSKSLQLSPNLVTSVSLQNHLCLGPCPASEMETTEIRGNTAIATHQWCLCVSASDSTGPECELRRRRKKKKKYTLLLCSLISALDGFQ